MNIESLQGRGVSNNLGQSLKSLMPSSRGQLSLVPVNAPAAGSMPLGPPQRMHGRRSAWRSLGGAEHEVTRSPRKPVISQYCGNFIVYGLKSTQLQLMMPIVGLLQFYVLLAFSLSLSHEHVARIMSLGEAEILWGRCGRGNLL